MHAKRNCVFSLSFAASHISPPLSPRTSARLISPSSTAWHCACVPPYGGPVFLEGGSVSLMCSAVPWCGVGGVHRKETALVFGGKKIKLFQFRNFHLLPKH